MSTSSSRIVYLITGSNRGIGFAIVKTILSQDNAIIFAGVRDPFKCEELKNLAEKHPEKLYIVKLISADKQSNEIAAKEIKEKAGKLDVVIANAAILSEVKPAIEVEQEDMMEQFRVNTVGPLTLFQSTWPLLQHSTPSPKFIPISSVCGSLSIGTAFEVNLVSYGTSKAALNFITRRIAFEHKDLVCFPICPGLVRTDMLGFTMSQDPGNTAVYKLKTPEEAAGQILHHVNIATRESHGNIFVNADGGTYDW